MPLTPFQKIGVFLAGLALLSLLGESFPDTAFRFVVGALLLAAGIVVLVVLMRLVTRPG